MWLHLYSPAYLFPQVCGAAPVRAEIYQKVEGGAAPADVEYSPVPNLQGQIAGATPLSQLFIYKSNFLQFWNLPDFNSLYLNLPEFIEMYLNGFTWVHLGSLGFNWVHLCSLWLTWVHFGSLGITWIHLALLGNTWVHLDSLGFTWVHLCSLGLILLDLGDLE